MRISSLTWYIWHPLKFSSIKFAAVVSFALFKAEISWTFRAVLKGNRRNIQDKNWKHLLAFVQHRKIPVTSHPVYNPYPPFLTLLPLPPPPPPHLLYISGFVTLYRYYVEFRFFPLNEIKNVSLSVCFVTFLLFRLQVHIGYKRRAGLVEKWKYPVIPSRCKNSQSFFQFFFLKKIGSRILSWYTWFSYLFERPGASNTLWLFARWANDLKKVRRKYIYVNLWKNNE